MKKETKWCLTKICTPTPSKKSNNYSKYPIAEDFTSNNAFYTNPLFVILSKGKNKEYYIDLRLVTLQQSEFVFWGTIKSSRYVKTYMVINYFFSQIIYFSTRQEKWSRSDKKKIKELITSSKVGFLVGLSCISSFISKRQDDCFTSSTSSTGGINFGYYKLGNEMLRKFSLYCFK